MPASALETFVSGVRSVWGPLTTPLVGKTLRLLEALARASSSEPWLAELHAALPASVELHRDPQHGFMLLAHVEHAGLYRPPHDHGRAWVVYAVQHGALEIRTFKRLDCASGAVRLVQRDSVVLRAGEARAYLPGDIHDTRCLSDAALLFRFTERDLRHEDRVERQVARFDAPQDAWTADA